MKTLTISGPTKLSGSVKIQGAKNAAMKYVILPLLTNSQFLLHNIPDIGSTRSLAKITQLLGGRVFWQGNGDVAIDCSSVSSPREIPSELFYYTSGAIFLPAILASRFGKCDIEIDPGRTDTGGDPIGTRNFAGVISDLDSCGIKFEKDANLARFSLASHQAFCFTPRNQSFGGSLIALLAALFKKGRSVISQPSVAAEFLDIIKFLQNCGAEIVFDQGNLVVDGERQLEGTKFTCMSDKNDLATWVLAAIATESEITLTDVTSPKELGIEALLDLLLKWNIGLKFNGSSAQVDLKKSALKPVRILAGNPPLFHTDWQPLLSPILTKITGESTIVDTIFDNRMQHWLELGKMGAKYHFYQDPKYPEKDGYPRAVKVAGPVELVGAEVEARDVRAGAGLAIAALMAKGKTRISGIEHIERGYEDFAGRLQKLGVF